MKMAELCTRARSSLGTRPSHAVSSSETRQGETIFVMQDAIHHVGGGKDMKSHHSNNQHALMTFPKAGIMDASYKDRSTN